MHRSVPGKRSSVKGVVGGKKDGANRGNIIISERDRQKERERGIDR